jgi:hypothetical protein
MELTYRREGDYLLPNLNAPENPRIGKYGMLRHRYLREHKRAILTGLQMTGRLNAHLEQIDREATETVERLTAEMASRQGVNEQMKRTDQMRWVGMMNSLRASAEETVLNELVYR